MSQTKRASKGKRPSKAVSVLGMAGAALASSASESVADIPVADMLPQNTIPFQVVLGEEEITDVSLATFHLFDKDDLGTGRFCTISANRPYFFGREECSSNAAGGTRSDRLTMCSQAKLFHKFKRDRTASSRCCAPGHPTWTSASSSIRRLRRSSAIISPSEGLSLPVMA